MVLALGLLLLLLNDFRLWSLCSVEVWGNIKRISLHFPSIHRLHTHIMPPHDDVLCLIFLSISFLFNGKVSFTRSTLLMLLFGSCEKCRTLMKFLFSRFFVLHSFPTTDNLYDVLKNSKLFRLCLKREEKLLRRHPKHAASANQSTQQRMNDDKVRNEHDAK